MPNFALAWDEVGKKLYETGTDRGVLYPQANDGTYPKGVAWSGLTGVTESPSGGDPNDIYADNIKYLSLRAAEDFGATVTCYTYPDEWEECDGSRSPVAGVTLRQQVRKPFGLCFRSIVGNDTEMNDHGYKLHLIYNATASPSERGYSTVNDSPEAIEFSYELTTTPTGVSGYKPVASMTIDSTKTDPTKLAQLEQILYGTAGGSDPRLPLPDEVISILGGSSTYSVTVIPSRVELTVGETYVLDTQVTPAGTAVTWSSSSSSYATVSEAGVVTAAGAGTATITATISDGTDSYTDTCEVVVSAAVAG